MTIKKVEWRKYSYLDGEIIVTYHKELYVSHYVWDFKNAIPSQHTLFVLSFPVGLEKNDCISHAAKRLLSDQGEHLAENLVVFAKGCGRQVYIRDARNIVPPFALMGTPMEYMLEQGLLKI